MSISTTPSASRTRWTAMRRGCWLLLLRSRSDCCPVVRVLARFPSSLLSLSAFLPVFSSSSSLSFLTSGALVSPAGSAVRGGEKKDDGRDDDEDGGEENDEDHDDREAEGAAVVVVAAGHGWRRRHVLFFVKVGSVRKRIGGATCGLASWKGECVGEGEKMGWSQVWLLARDERSEGVLTKRLRL